MELQLIKINVVIQTRVVISLTFHCCTACKSRVQGVANYSPRKLPSRHFVTCVQIKEHMQAQCPTGGSGCRQDFGSPCKMGWNLTQPLIHSTLCCRTRVKVSPEPPDGYNVMMSKSIKSPLGYWCNIKGKFVSEVSSGYQKLEETSLPHSHS